MRLLPREKNGIFDGYWLADFCAQHHITFGLGYTLYLKATQSGKLIVKRTFFDCSVNLDRCLVQTPLGDDLTPVTKKQKPEPTSRLPKICFEDGKFIYCSCLSDIGERFSLTTEGHIDVGTARQRSANYNYITVEVYV